MRLPWIEAAVYREMQPRALKLLVFLVLNDRRGRYAGSLIELGMQTGMATVTVRRALRDLGELGLVRYEASTAGYRVHVPFTKRFTCLHTTRTNLVMALSPAALKTYVAICRMLQPTRCVRALIATIAERIGRSRRSVQLALAELRRAGMLWGIRTGRSSVHVVERGDHLFAPRVAHHSRLLLRLLSSTPEQVLSSTLARLRSTDKADACREALAMKTTDGWIMRALRRAGVGLDEAGLIMALCTRDEITHSLDRLAGRRVSNPGGAILSWIRRGWCGWSEGGMMAGKERP